MESVYIYLKCFVDHYQTWILSVLSSTLIGLAGILPVFAININDGCHQKNRDRRRRLLLSFAAGSLLGDVFLHLLPEAAKLSLELDRSPHSTYHSIGIWILFGIFTFVMIEIIFNTNCKTTQNNSLNVLSNKELPKEENKRNERNISDKYSKTLKALESTQIETTGYLNLLANGIDNFSHGLAISASYMSGTKIGLLTTFTIIIHEIPHEFGDFAILFESGFSKYNAIRAQLLTSAFGVCGTLFALSFQQINSPHIQVWVLSFTCGAFINIALVGILPKLLQEDDSSESIKQIVVFGLGIAIMAFVNCF